MSDKLIFDLAQEVEGSPNVFIRKDWINILDNQNQNYNNNQSVIDTSQLSNSNKYMSYREAYFSVPFLLTLGTSGAPVGSATFGTEDLTPYFRPTSYTSAPGITTVPMSSDYAIGLKNWFGQIIHSFTVDYNGTTIVQQTPFINMWNSFKLMTSLSLDDINTQGATIGFYPDDADTWQWASPFTTAGAVTGAMFPYGQGVCNNSNLSAIAPVSGIYNTYSSGLGNSGLRRRQQLINFDLRGIPSIATTASAGAVGAPVVVPEYSSYGSFMQSASNMNLLWKSYISNVQNQTALQAGFLQISIVATIYLKHIHSFFNMCPLLKGVFMKMTMNLNNTTTSFSGAATFGAGAVSNSASLWASSVASPLGGVNPTMIASASGLNGSKYLIPAYAVTAAFGTQVDAINTLGAVAYRQINYKLNYTVGSICSDSGLSSTGAQVGALSKSVYLYIPSYTFNPIFEQAYLSSPVKQIKYTDVYQYQVLTIPAGQTYNNLLTNGIANIKSVLILPYFSAGSTNVTSFPVPVALGGGVGVTQSVSANSGFVAGLPVFQSPFDPAGTGPTSPMCWLSNFNVQISGQNAIYNTQKYNFEQFNNQLYGQNAVNGGMTDGLTSGLVDRQKFDLNYSYYYVNVERMLPVEMSVPKSVQILGQNLSSKSIDLYCFIEYGMDVSIDALTGARV